MRSDAPTSTLLLSPRRSIAAQDVSLAPLGLSNHSERHSHPRGVRPSKPIRPAAAAAAASQGPSQSSPRRRHIAAHIVLDDQPDDNSSHLGAADGGSSGVSAQLSAVPSRDARSLFAKLRTHSSEVASQQVDAPMSWTELGSIVSTEAREAIRKRRERAEKLEYFGSLQAGISRVERVMEHLQHDPGAPSHLDGSADFAAPDGARSAVAREGDGLSARASIEEVTRGTMAERSNLKPNPDPDSDPEPDSDPNARSCATRRPSSRCRRCEPPICSTRCTSTPPPPRCMTSSSGSMPRPTTMASMRGRTACSKPRQRRSRQAWRRQSKRLAKTAQNITSLRLCLFLSLSLLLPLLPLRTEAREKMEPSHANLSTTPTPTPTSTSTVASTRSMSSSACIRS